MSAYNFIPSAGSEVPVLISVPHCGIEFPNELRSEYKEELIVRPDDTDWFVNQLYDFAAGMGIRMISARYSRWVIDLNRDPESKPLYEDGRIITGLCPTTTFLGQPLYRDERKELSAQEIQRRVEKYYVPYHHRIESELHDLKMKFGKVLLWDCHSIRQSVPSIHPKSFPDLILGDVDGTSASPLLINTALRQLGTGSCSLSHNYLFKGGYITRNFGKPLHNQHALQLEMTKVNYMNDPEMEYDAAKANVMRSVLKNTFEGLIGQLQVM